MAHAIKLPALGENIEEAEVLKLLVAEGDLIERDQPLAELETDKATVEIPSPVGGVIRTIHVAEGDRVRVDQLLFEVEAGESEADEKPAAPPAAAPPTRRSAEPEPPRPTLEPTRPSRPPAAAATPQAAAGSDPSPRLAAPAAPSVRQLARELGIDVNEMSGSGPGGRISLEDVKQHARRLIDGRGTANAAATTGLVASQPPLPDFSRFGEVERRAMRGVRRRTAENMSRAWLTIPHVTQFDRADITELDATRRRFAARAEAAGGKLTLTAIVIKVLAAAVRIFPKFNASLDVANEEIVFKKFVNVGVAVDTEHGLLVPVLRNADCKNVVQIGSELTDLSARARIRKLRPEELQGTTITVTNLGGLGTTYFSPIVNWPEVAVLGVGRANLEAVHRDGAFEPRLVMPLSVSYDHRLIDGADAARFARWIAEALENPFLLALEG